MYFHHEVLLFHHHALSRVLGSQPFPPLLVTHNVLFIVFKLTLRLLDFRPGTYNRPQKPLIFRVYLDRLSFLEDSVTRAHLAIVTLDLRRDQALSQFRLAIVYRVQPLVQLAILPIDLDTFTLLAMGVQSYSILPITCHLLQVAITHAIFVDAFAVGVLWLSDLFQTLLMSIILSIQKVRLLWAFN